MFCRSVRGSCLFAALLACAVVASAQKVVGPDDLAYQERSRASFVYSPFGNDWRVLSNDIFFGGAKGLFGLSPAGLLRRQLGPGPDETAAASSFGSISAPNSRPNDTLFSFNSAAFFGAGSGSRGALFLSAPAGPITGPNAIQAVKTWNNLGTDFDDDASWIGGKPGLNDIATFTIAKVTDPIVTNTSTQTILGLAFDTGGIGYTISSNPNAILGIGTGGISAANITGANTITAGLLLNFDQSITQAAGGTLNITGPVILGPGTGITTLTIGDGSGGTINFSPSSVAIGNTINFVTNVNVTLPAITLSPAPPFVAGIIKSGPNTLTLTGASNYNGTTTINGGTLLVNNTTGSGTGTGAVVANANTILGGTGTVDGPVTINAGAGLNPGPAVGVGALSMNNNVAFVGIGSGLGEFATYVVEISGTSSDRMVIGGTLDLTNAFDRIDFNGTPNGSATYVLATYSSVLGEFNFTNTPAGYTLVYGDGELDLVPIPEPSTWLGGALALGAVAFAQRRRLRKTSK